MLRVMTLEAAERARIDIVSVPSELMLDPRFREAAPGVVAMPGENFYAIGMADDFLCWAFRLYEAGADAVYCSAGHATVKRLADDSIPVIGHVGLIRDPADHFEGDAQDGPCEPAEATHCVAPVRRLERASAEAEGGAAGTVGW